MFTKKCKSKLGKKYWSDIHKKLALICNIKNSIKLVRVQTTH